VSLLDNMPTCDVTYRCAECQEHFDCSTGARERDLEAQRFNLMKVRRDELDVMLHDAAEVLGSGYTMTVADAAKVLVEKNARLRELLAECEGIVTHELEERELLGMKTNDLSRRIRAALGETK